MLAKNILAFIVLLCFINNVFANNRPTTFDDRSYCEKSQGVWREFGNGCIDNCLKKIDPYNIVCTSALTYGCECGKNRCWNGEKCVAIQEYQLEYNTQQDQENLASNKDRLARQQEAQKFRRDYLEKLIKGEKTSTAQVAENKEKDKEKDPNSFTGSNKKLIYDRFEGKKITKKKDLQQKLAQINEEQNNTTQPQTTQPNTIEKSSIVNNNPPATQNIDNKKPDSTSGFLDSLGDKFNKFLSSPSNNNEIPPVYVAPQNGANFNDSNKVIDNLNKNTSDLPIVPLD